MTDVIVVGGGLIGMLTARELQLRGAHVTLLERGRMGGESTWAGGGILSPLYPWRYGDAVNRLAIYGHRVYPQLAGAILAESGIDAEYTRSGLLVLDQHENAEAQAWAARWQMSLCRLDQTALHQQEPVLNADVPAALWLPDIAQLRNPRLIKALVGSLQQRGVVCIENCEVQGLKIRDGRVSGVSTRGAEYGAGQVILAGGAWSAGLLQDQTQSLPQIQPVKGQMIIFRGEPGQLHSIVLHQGRYLIPRRDGRILAGSTLEYTGFEKQTTEKARQELHTSALAMMPGLRDMPVEHHWAGLRPGSPQGVPYICAHPELEGLYINAGHFRNGVILGAASAVLMADLVTRTAPAIDPSFYRFDAVH